MDKIYEINKAIDEYFKLNQSVDEIRPKDLMPLLIKNGVFEIDHRNGLPLRKILRELDSRDQLYLIPSLYADRKKTNTYWYFRRYNSAPSMSKVEAPAESEKPILKTNNTSSRKVSDESYVIDLCDKALNLTASRQHKFPFLLGDPSENGRQAKLPVDAYYESLSLVVEYRERQHTEEVKHFDKPDVMTVSGVHRGEQRKKYDQRRRDELPKHGIKLIEISYSDFDHDSQKKLIRNYVKDIKTVKKILSDNNILGVVQ